VAARPPRNAYEVAPNPTPFYLIIVMGLRVIVKGYYKKNLIGIKFDEGATQAVILTGQHL